MDFSKRGPYLHYSNLPHPNGPPGFSTAHPLLISTFSACPFPFGNMYNWVCRSARVHTSRSVASTTRNTDIARPCFHYPAMVLILDASGCILTGATYQNMPTTEAEVLAIAHAIVLHIKIKLILPTLPIHSKPSTFTRPAKPHGRPSPCYAACLGI